MKITDFGTNSNLLLYFTVSEIWQIAGLNFAADRGFLYVKNSFSVTT